LPLSPDSASLFFKSPPRKRTSSSKLKLEVSPPHYPVSKKYPPLCKRLISGRKLLNSTRKVNALLHTPEREAKKDWYEELIRSSVSPPKNDIDSQRIMRAALKFLRRLGHQIRQEGSPDALKQVLETNTSLSKIGSNIKEKYSEWDSPDDTSHQLSLSEIMNGKSPINLDDDETQYLQLQCEYRNFDANKFKAHRLKYAD